MYDLALVLDVDVYIALPVAHRELWLAIKADCACHLAGGSVNRRHIIAATVEGKYALAVRVVQNPVRILACRYLLQNRVRLQVEYYDDVVAAIANEAPVEIIGDQRCRVCVSSP